MWLVIACDDEGKTVELHGPEWEALADRVASWAQQEQDRWPGLGLVYMLVHSDDLADYQPAPQPSEADLRVAVGTIDALLLGRTIDDPAQRLALSRVSDWLEEHLPDEPPPHPPLRKG